jgi:hypothetical protein
VSKEASAVSSSPLPKRLAKQDSPSSKEAFGRGFGLDCTTGGGSCKRVVLTMRGTGGCETLPEAEPVTLDVPEALPGSTMS